MLTKRAYRYPTTPFHQTDHVEFNLQSAVVEALDNNPVAHEGGLGDAGYRPRRANAFRIVTYVNGHRKKCPPSSSPVPPRSNHHTRNGVEETAAVLAGGGLGGGGGGGSSSRNGGGRNGQGKQQQQSRQVWVLAATSEKVSASPLLPVLA